MAKRSRLTEVAGPDGGRYLVGSGGFARQPGGAFSIVVYPYGHGDAGGPATHIEPVVSAAEFRCRTEELVEAIRSGVWRPPQHSDEEKERLAARKARVEAALASPPTRIAKIKFAVFAVLLGVFVLGTLLNIVLGHTPSPVGPLYTIAIWYLVLDGLIPLVKSLCRRWAGGGNPGAPIR